MSDEVVRRLMEAGSSIVAQSDDSDDDDNTQGTSGDDVLTGGPGSDTLSGRSGDDIIRGRGGDDELSGGSGNDAIFGGAGDDDILGGSGNDQISGGIGDDTISAGSGDDSINAGAGDDTVRTGSGNDTIVYSGDFGDDVIVDFNPDEDVIDLTAFTGVTSLDQLTFTEDGSDTIITADDFEGSITVRGVSAQELKESGSVEVACFLEGTAILTPDGERAVETLRIGDKVTTIDGLSRRIKWVGVRSFSTRFVKNSKRLMPVTVKAGALGPDLPVRDLRLSPGHSLYMEGVLVNADLLLNGVSVHQRFDGDRISYFHIELETPDVIFADGAPAETYVNDANRRQFANWQEYGLLYGEDVPADRLASGLVAHRFPHVEAGAPLQRLRQAVAARVIAVDTKQVA
jgi:hypothetical protein